MSEPARFGVIGTGWRGQFFLRLAAQAPERFVVCGVVTRSVTRAAEVERQWRVETFGSLDEMLAAQRPEFVIPCVPWAEMPDAVRLLVGRGIPALAETPPAPNLDGLRSLWSDVGTSGLVQVAEQYVRMPAHAARLALLQEGLIGQVTSVQVSSTHLYHAVSMMRHMMGVGFDNAVVSAQTFTAPLANPLTPSGWTGDSSPQQLETTIATLDFGGRVGLYDFTDNQWWNPLRSRRIVIRGSLGEIVDGTVVRLVDPTSPVESHLVRRRTGTDLNLEGVDLDHISFDGRIVYRNDFFGARYSEDDLAVAALLAAMTAWCRGEGPPPYPLADGCQDHLIGLAMLDSARSGKPVAVSREAWAG